MGFGDFVWFILCVEDKTTEQSIEFWFKIMDLDGNGLITGYFLCDLGMSWSTFTRSRARG